MPKTNCSTSNKSVHLFTPDIVKNFLWSRGLYCKGVLLYLFICCMQKRLTWTCNKVMPCHDCWGGHVGVGVCLLFFQDIWGCLFSIYRIYKTRFLKFHAHFLQHVEVWFISTLYQSSMQSFSAVLFCICWNLVLLQVCDIHSRQTFKDCFRSPRAWWIFSDQSWRARS